MEPASHGAPVDPARKDLQRISIGLRCKGLRKIRREPLIISWEMLVEERQLYAAFTLPAESKTLEEGSDEENTLNEIVELMGNERHPASLISALRSVLEDNPVLLNHVPDVQERLGMISSESQGLVHEGRETGTLIFVSFSLGQKEIENLFAVNVGKKDVTLLFEAYLRE